MNFYIVILQKNLRGIQYQIPGYLNDQINWTAAGYQAKSLNTRKACLFKWSS